MVVIDVVVMVMVCGRRGYDPRPSWFVAICRHCNGRHGHGLCLSWFAAIIAAAVMVVAVKSWFVAVMVMVCGRHGLWPSWLWFVAVIVEPSTTTTDAVVVLGYVRYLLKT